jgi:hypothetical protein
VKANDMQCLVTVKENLTVAGIVPNCALDCFVVYLIILMQLYRLLSIKWIT